RAAFGGRLHKIICGGAAMNPELIPIFESFGISIYEGYGITECAPLVAVTPYYKRKCGSVGPAVPCCEVRIEGLETNEDGYVTGEIQVKGDNVMLGYMDPEANAAAFTDDGWFKTGDIGHMDNDGYIYITGRLKSVIVLENGKNVFPEEIEEYLDSIDEIEESVVIGREAEDGTVKLVAVVYPASESFPEKSEEELRATIQKAVAELNKKNPSFKQIHKLEFRKTPFEKTTTKKIKRHLVK
ncbi:MAG: AMP-binding protein, partial [Clostridia bacterium]|nr:AMP-binding protein [Clostridia bacterium]